LITDFAHNYLSSSNSNKTSSDLKPPIPLQKNETKYNQPSHLSFEEFIKQKPSAFLFFSTHPNTAQLFAPKDIEKFSQVSKDHTNSSFNIYFYACVLTHFADKWLKKQYPIYGLTSRFSVLKILVKFWLIPTDAANVAASLFFDDEYQRKTNLIARGYDYTEEIFRSAYEKSEIIPPAQRLPLEYLTDFFGLKSYIINRDEKSLSNVYFEINDRIWRETKKKTASHFDKRKNSCLRSINPKGERFLFPHALCNPYHI